MTSAWHSRVASRRSTAAVAGTALLLMAAAFASGPAAAQGSVTQGAFTVHYSAVPTATLAPEVARRYAITRSASRALLSLVVLRAGDDAVPMPVRAKVDARRRDAGGRDEALAVREVVDGDAVTYLAEPRIGARERVDFVIAIVPVGESAPIEVRFSQEFFPDTAR